MLGSFGYAVLTSIGLTPRDTILIMLFIPVLMAISYVTLPSIEFAKARYRKDDDDLINNEEEEPDLPSNDSPIQINLSVDDSVMGKFKSKLKILRPLLKYMIPLFIVYWVILFDLIN